MGDRARARVSRDGWRVRIASSPSHNQIFTVSQPVGRNACGLYREGHDTSNYCCVGVDVAAGTDGPDDRPLVVVQVASRNPQAEGDRVLTPAAASLSELTPNLLHGH